MGLFSKPAPEKRMVNGKVMQCLVCGNDHFYEREAQLNTAGASLMGMDWANQSGVCLVCSKCTYIHWFLPD